MKMLLSAVVAACLLLAGCQTPPSYTVAGKSFVDHREASRVQLEAINSVLAADKSGRWDTPPVFLASPLPAAGPVAVALTAKFIVKFDESGKPVGIEMFRGPSQAQIAAIEAAVAQWRISPPTKDGKPIKFNAEQSYMFHPGGRGTTAELPLRPAQNAQ